MKFRDRDVVTLATWAPTSNETGTLIHYARAVRPITEFGVSELSFALAFPGDPHRPTGTAERWRLVKEGHERQVALVGHTNQMDDFVIGIFAYVPTWRTVRFRLFKPRRQSGKKHIFTEQRLRYVLSAWHLLLGQPLDSMALLSTVPQLVHEDYRSPPGIGKRGIRKDIGEVYESAPPLTLTYDVSSYALLGLPYPWMESHDSFMAWLEGVRE